MKSIRFLIPLGVFVALCILFFSMLDRDTQLLPSPLVNKPIPRFSLPSLQHASKTVTKTITARTTVTKKTDSTHKQELPITEKSFIGQKWLLNIWASWCAACRIEHPLFNQIAHQKNWLLVGLNYKDKTNDANQWLQQMQNPYQHIIFDQKGSLGLDLGVYGVPETFLINDAGIVIYKHVGPICAKIVEKVITPFFQGNTMDESVQCGKT